MPDRVREAIFSILGTMFDCPGELPPIHVADAFAGSGSLGLEALSRRAISCCFLESKRLALEALKKNLDELGVGPTGTIVTSDAWSVLPAEHQRQPFRLVFLDPPYVDSVDWNPHGRVPRLLAELARIPGPLPLVVVHHEARTSAPPPMVPPWNVVDHRIYGTNAITFLHS